MGTKHALGGEGSTRKLRTHGELRALVLDVQPARSTALHDGSRTGDLCVTRVECRSQRLRVRNWSEISLPPQSNFGTKTTGGRAEEELAVLGVCRGVCRGGLGGNQSFSCRQHRTREPRTPSLCGPRHRVLLIR